MDGFVVPSEGRSIRISGLVIQIPFPSSGTAITNSSNNNIIKTNIFEKKPMMLEKKKKKKKKRKKDQCQFQIRRVT